MTPPTAARVCNTHAGRGRAGAGNTHAHTYSCKTGKLGAIGCRFGYPKGHPVPATGMLPAAMVESRAA